MSVDCQPGASQPIANWRRLSHRACATSGLLALTLVAGCSGNPRRGDLKERVVQHGGTVQESPEGLLVDLGKSRITDSDLANLGDLSEVAALVLRRTAVTNDGLAHLRSAKRLSVLDLSNTRVTDAGLGHLKPLPALTDVVLLGCEVSEAAVESLQQARPNTTIICDAPWAAAKGN